MKMSASVFKRVLIHGENDQTYITDNLESSSDDSDEEQIITKYQDNALFREAILIK